MSTPRSAACARQGIGLIAFGLGCGNARLLEVDDDGTSSTSGAPGTGAPDGPDTSVDASSDGGPITTSPPDCEGFICEPDVGDVNIECDVWAPECRSGEKCMPWANDGGGSWNATRCSPIDPTPAQVGEPCTVEGSGVSGIDDCDIAAMCWNVDPETNTGICYDFCRGSEANPTCLDPASECIVYGDGVIILCYPPCDPLAQVCGEGQACYPISDTFRCTPDASGEMGAFGDACEYLNTCDAGLFCAEPANVPGCEGSGCCTEFCDLAAPDPEAMCSGAAQGQVCLPFHELGHAPPGLADVGLCVLPE